MVFHILQSWNLIINLGLAVYLRQVPYSHFEDFEREELIVTWETEELVVYLG